MSPIGRLTLRAMSAEQEKNHKCQYQPQAGFISMYQRGGNFCRITKGRNAKDRMYLYC